MKTCKLIFFFLFSSLTIFSQSYNSEKIEMTNFLTRMYESKPFEGVKLFTDYENSYLLSVLTLDKSKYTNESVMFRVASVKATAQVSRFFNGSQITSDLVISSKENGDGTSETEMIERINEKSFGWTEAVELLTNFTQEDKEVFIYYVKVE
ncbi:MAG: hypothetical protein MJZ30_08130 [Paludibacteraceae bacterium]|nr:hypothetical protein [Paludibacteraceae bacterium]